jgi:hypothetical protein
VKAIGKIFIPIFAAAATWGMTTLVMQAVFASQPGGLRDFGAVLGLLFWLGVPILVLVQTAKALNRSREDESSLASTRGDFAGCLLVAAIPVGLWMVVVSGSEGWSSGPLYFAAVIVGLPVLSLMMSSLAAKRRERRRIVEDRREEQRRRKEIEYRNTHCPVCGATDPHSRTDVQTYEGTEMQSDYEARYNSEGRFIGHSEHFRTVPATKREYTTWLTCKQCREVWREE